MISEGNIRRIVLFLICIVAMVTVREQSLSRVYLKCRQLQDNPVLVVFLNTGLYWIFACLLYLLSVCCQETNHGPAHRHIINTNQSVTQSMSCETSYKESTLIPSCVQHKYQLSSTSTGFMGIRHSFLCFSALQVGWFLQQDFEKTTPQRGPNSRQRRLDICPDSQWKANRRGR